MAWGSANPTTLFLGFSKGTNQSHELLTAAHDGVAFSRFRGNVTKALQVLGLLPLAAAIDDQINAKSEDWAFGSVVRCSVSKFNAGKNAFVKSGDVIASSASRRGEQDWIGRCMRQHLAVLPARLKTVVLLSNDDRYVDACFARIREIHPAVRRINQVAYGDGRVTWVHIVHVGGPGANHTRDWLAGAPNRQGEKMRMARAALAGGDKVAAN